MEDLVLLLKIIVIGLVVIAICYGVVRGMSFAYFRTKLEHFRAVMKESRRDDTK